MVEIIYTVGNIGYYLPDGIQGASNWLPEDMLLAVQIASMQAPDMTESLNNVVDLERRALLASMVNRVCIHSDTFGNQEADQLLGLLGR